MSGLEPPFRFLPSVESAITDYEKGELANSQNHNLIVTGNQDSGNSRILHWLKEHGAATGNIQFFEFCATEPRHLDELLRFALPNGFYLTQQCITQVEEILYDLEEGAYEDSEVEKEDLDRVLESLENDTPLEVINKIDDILEKYSDDPLKEEIESIRKRQEKVRNRLVQLREYGYKNHNLPDTFQKSYADGLNQSFDVEVLVPISDSMPTAEVPEFFTQFAISRENASDIGIERLADEGIVRETDSDLLQSKLKDSVLNSESDLVILYTGFLDDEDIKKTVISEFLDIYEDVLINLGEEEREELDRKFVLSGIDVQTVVSSTRDRLVDLERQLSDMMKSGRHFNTDLWLEVAPEMSGSALFKSVQHTFVTSLNEFGLDAFPWSEGFKDDFRKTINNSDYGRVDDQYPEFGYGFVYVDGSEQVPFWTLRGRKQYGHRLPTPRMCAEGSFEDKDEDDWKIFDEEGLQFEWVKSRAGES